MDNKHDLKNNILVKQIRLKIHKPTYNGGDSPKDRQRLNLNNR